MKKLHQLSLLSLLMISLAGCNKIPGISSAASCDDNATKQLVNSTFTKSLNDAALTEVKEMSHNGQEIDLGKVRGTLKDFAVNLVDVRTSNKDPNSKKSFCVARLEIKVPAKLVQEANESRKIYDSQNVNQQAIGLDLQFENFTLSHELEYSVQSTDDNKTVYVQLDNAEAPINFLNSVAIDALQKAIRQNQMALAQEEEQKRVQEEQQAMLEYQQLKLTEAQKNLEGANGRLNEVWGAISKDTRNQLLEDQRLWLKKRGLECKINSSGETDQDIEISRLNCETNMTNDRAQGLKRYVYSTDYSY